MQVQVLFLRHCISTMEPMIFFHFVRLEIQIEHWWHYHKIDITNLLKVKSQNNMRIDRWCWVMVPGDT